MTSLSNEKIETMDENILLSIINMSLRDNYDSLDSLCYDMDISKDLVNARLNNLGYKYDFKYNKYF